MTTSRVFLTAAMMLVHVAAAAGQSTTGSVTGRVLTADGRALVSALVDVENRSVQGVSTDSLGEFRLSGLMPGQLVVRARLVGHEVYRQRIELAPRGSLHIIMRLRPAMIRIPGADRLLSSAAVRAEAETLLPDLLEQPDVQALIREAFTAPSDPVVAWIPWASSPGVQVLDGVVDSAVSVHLTPDCGVCSDGSTSHTVEGGRQYRSARRHLRIGVTPERVDESAISFCIAAPEVGEVLMQNCGSGGRALQLRYERQANGEWTRPSRQPDL